MAEPLVIGSQSLLSTNGLAAVQFLRLIPKAGATDCGFAGQIGHSIFAECRRFSRNRRESNALKRLNQAFSTLRSFTIPQQAVNHHPP